MAKFSIAPWARAALRKSAAVALASGLLSAARPAAAEPYVVAGVGSQSSAIAAIGYQVNRYVAAEASYFTAREEVTVQTIGTTPPGPGLVPSGASSQQSGESVEERRLEGLGVSAIGAVPLGRVAVLGELGAYRMGGYGLAEQWVLITGAGVRVDLPHRFAARAMYKRTSSSGEIPSTDTIALQLQYTF